jgi:hypothetical protein
MEARERPTPQRPFPQDPTACPDPHQQPRTRSHRPRRAGCTDAHRHQRRAN